MANEKEIARTYKEIREDYTWDPSIFNLEDERVSELKRIIHQSLTQVEQTIILLYVELQSFRKLGARLGVSKETCRQMVLKIKKKIITEYNEHIH